MVRVAYDGSWFDNLDDTLVWDSPLRLTDSTSAPGPRAHGAVAVEHRPDGQRGRLREVRAPHAGHRLRVVRVAEQRRAAAALHDQPDAAAAGAAAGQRPTAEAQIFSANVGLVSRPSDGLAVQRAPAPLRLRQRDAAGRHPAVHQLRHVGEGLRDRRPGAVRARPHDVRRRRDVDAACSRWRSPPATPLNSNGYDAPHLREQRRAASSRSRPTPSATSG